MKKTALLLALALTSAFAHNVVVNIENITNTKGILQLKIESYNGSQLEKIKGVTLAPNKKGATHTFTNIQNGKYAISIYHDENNNKKLDKNFIGLPKEDYGFSNNPSSSLGAPKLEEKIFEVSKDVSLTVNL